MIPQGSAILNTAYFQSATNRVNAARSCAELQAIVTDVFGSVQAVQTSIGTELAAVQPILALLAAPASNPADIVTWITSFITGFLTPYTKPTVTYAAQLTAMAAQIAALTAAITAAQGRFSGCAVSVPPIV